MDKNNNKFISNIVILLSGTATAQMLNIMLSPVITRIYTPEEFGILAIFSVFLIILGVTTLKFELAIPIASTDREATFLILVSLSISIILNISIMFLLLIFGSEVNRIFGLDSNPFIIYLVPLGAFLISVFNIFRQWSIRMSDYKVLSRATVMQSLGGNVAKILFGILSFGAMGLTVSRILSGSLGVFTLSKSLVINYKELIKKEHYQEFINLIKRYKNFPIYMTPNSLLIIFVSQIPVITIGVLYTPEITGFYSLANTIIMLPLAILGDAIGDVFYSESAKIIKKSPEKVRSKSRRLVLGLFFISLIPTLILLLFGPRLFGIVFGETWSYAGVFSQVLSLILVTKMAFNPLNKIFELIERQKDKLYLNIAQSIMLSIIFLISYIFILDPIMFLILYSVVVSIMNILAYLWSQLLLRKYIIINTNSINL